jgi:hypothetical protein
MTTVPNPFYTELKTLLPKSSGTQRRLWAEHIVEKQIDLKALAELLKEDTKIATRFLWLLTDVGMANSIVLLNALPFLLRQCDHLPPIYKTSFASFWLLTGVPPKNEAEAIELLFYWLMSPEINITIKSRAALVVFNLAQKYPELQNELKLCLQDQKDKYSADFRKRTNKLLLKLE